MSTVVIPTITAAPLPIGAPRRISVLWSIAALALIAVIAGLGLLTASGGRIMMVETPSMGEVAPVGSLVIEHPIELSAVRTGDIVTFAVDERPGITYTHRVIGINADGTLTTKGDINGATDPWPVSSDMLLGTPTAIVPAVGWLATATPVLLIGSLLIWTLTAPFVNTVTRSSLRLAGASLVFSYASFLYKPFVNLVTITNTASHGLVDATVVSTGILPIRATGPGGAAVTLQPGEVGHLRIHELAHNGYYQVASTLHLDWAGWCIIAVVCALPLVISYGIGRNTSTELA